MWQSKRQVAVNVGDSGNAKCSGRPSRRKGGKKAAKKLLQDLGNSIESLIDASPIGVTTPIEKWNPSTDRKKALLSNPLSVLQAISETIDVLSSPSSKFFHSAGEAAEYWMTASSMMLMTLREGLANAVLVEESMEHSQEVENVDAPPVMVEVEMDTVVKSDSGAFVDLGGDKFGNSSPRAVNPVKETVSEVRAIKKRMSKFINKTALPFLDNLTLRANGIIVTSDDCSVECSLDSLVDDTSEAYIPAAVPESICSEDDFEECPSVVTEIAEDELEDAKEEDTKTIETHVSDEENIQETSDATNNDVVLASDDDQEEYVITEELESDDDEDFVTDFDV